MRACREKKRMKLTDRIKAEWPEMLKGTGIRFHLRETMRLRHDPHRIIINNGR